MLLMERFEGLNSIHPSDSAQLFTTVARIPLPLGLRAASARTTYTLIYPESYSRRKFFKLLLCSVVAEERERERTPFLPMTRNCERYFLCPLRPLLRRYNFANAIRVTLDLSRSAAPILGAFTINDTLESCTVPSSTGV